MTAPSPFPISGGLYGCGGSQMKAWATIALIASIFLFTIAEDASDSLSLRGMPDLTHWYGFVICHLSCLIYCLIVLSSLIPRPFDFLRIKYRINESASPLLL